MARKSKRQLELDKQNQELTEKARQAWLPRVIRALELCTTFSNRFTVQFIAERVIVTDDYERERPFDFPWEYADNWDDYSPLEDLERTFEEIDRERIAEENKRKLREQARAKLTDEEWEALR